MSAVITGANLGLFGSSANVLGAAGVLGQGLQGRAGAGSRVYVNAANGNLVLQSPDDILSGRGADLGLLRTYNSQGILDSSKNGLGWSWEGGDSYVVLSSGTGTLNKANSTVTRVTGDGHETIYTFNGTAYVSTDGDGAHDTLTHSGSTWTWTDGSSRQTETYADSLDDKTRGYLQSRTDATGNQVLFSRNGALLTGITDVGSGQHFELVYTAGRLTQVNTFELNVDANGKILQPPTVSTTPLKQVSYTYYDDGRLKTVSSYLKPDDPASKVFVTTYAYDAVSKCISSVTQNDGSSTSAGATVSFTYEQAPTGGFRVSSVTDSNGIQTFKYNADNTTTITVAGPGNTNPRTWIYTYDSKQQLTKVQQPDVNGAHLTTTFEYETAAANGAGHDGNLRKVTDARGLSVIYQYDANGNAILQRDSMGNTIERSYDANNQLKTETHFKTPDAALLDEQTKGIGSASGAMTTRYVYGPQSQLRFVISGEGRVKEMRYTANGLLERTIEYAGGRYDISALAIDDSPSEAAMAAWVSQAALDKSQIELTQFTYDFAGNLSRRIDFASADANGEGVTTDVGNVVTDFIYTAHGDLAQSVVRHGTALDQGTPTVYVHDGLGRLVSMKDAAGNLTTTTYDDLLGTITVKTGVGNAGPHLTTISAFNSAGQLVSVSQADADQQGVPARVTRYLYNEQGRLALMVDPQGGRHFTFYDAAGRVAFIVDSLGRVTGSTYDEDGHLLTQTQYSNRLKGVDDAHPAQGVTDLWLDSATNPTKVKIQTLVLGTDLIAAPDQDRVMAFHYDNANRLDVRTDASGVQTVNKYDGDSRLERQTTAERVQRSFFDRDGLLVGSLDALGNLVEYKYNSANQLVQTIRYATRSPQAVDSSRPLWVGADGNVIQTSATGGKPFTYRIPLVDGDGDAMDVSVTSKPAWLTVTRDAGGVTLTGTPPPATSLTTHQIQLTATEKRDSTVSTALTVNVKVDNTPPSWGTLPDFVITNKKSIDPPLALPVASDAESPASALQYSFDGLPAGITPTFDAAGNTLTLSGTPTLPGFYVVMATVKDAQGLTTQKSFTVQVADAGAPLVAPMSGQTATRMQPFNLVSLAPVDPDGQEAQFKYTTLDAPSWLSISHDLSTVTFQGTPPADSATGVQWVRIQVSDPQFGASIISFPITVLNAPPNWSANFGEVRTTSANVDFTPPPATDPEKHGAIQYFAFNLTPGMSFDGTNGRVSGNIAGLTPGGTRTISLQAVDADGGATVSSVTFRFDQAPVYNGGVPGSIGHRALPIRIPDSAFTDPDGDPVTIQASGLPPGVTFDGHWLSGIPTTLGTWNISFTAFDPSGLASPPVPSIIFRDADPPPPPINPPPSPFPGPPGPRPPILPKFVAPAPSGIGPTSAMTDPPAPELVQAPKVTVAATLPPPPLPITTLTPFEDVLATVRPAVNANDRTSYRFYDGSGRPVGELNEQGFLTETVYNDVLNTRDDIQYMNAVAFATGDTLKSLRDRALLNGGKKETKHTTFDDAGRVSVITDVDGTKTHLFYDSAGRVARKVHAEGQKEDDGTNAQRGSQTVFDAFGETVGTLGGVGDAWLAADPTRTLKDALARFGTTYEYNSLGQRTKATDANGHVTLFYYDSEGQLRFTIDAKGEVVENQYSNFGQLSGMRAYNARIASDGANSPLAQLQAAGGGAISALLTAQIGVIKDDALDHITSYLYDKRGLTRQVTDAEGFVTSDTYNVYGQLETEQRTIAKATATAAAVTTTRRLDYDLDGRLISTTDDLGGLNSNHQITYDGFGRALLTIDAQGRVSSSTAYKDNGRTVEVTDILGRTVRTEYDAYTRAVKVFDAVQMAIATASQRKATTYAYDNPTRKLIVTTPEGVRVTTVSTRSGEKLSVVDGRQGKTSYTYNQDGELLTATDALQHVVVRNEYDDSGRLKSSKDARDVVTAYEYDEVNRLITRRVDPTGLNLTTTYEFDAFGHQVTVTEGAGTASAQATKYEFDRDGRQFRITVDPQGLKLTTTYQYDGLDDILQVSHGTTASPDQLVTQYQFDKLGRRVKEIEAPSAVLGGGASNARDLTTDFHYDLNGLMTRRTDAGGNNTLYVYDDAGQLVQTIDALGSVTEISYDRDGRVARTIRYHNSVQVAPGDNTPRQTPGRTSADQVTYNVYDRDGRGVFTLRALVSGAWIISQNVFDADGNVVETRVYDKTLGDDRVAAIDTGGLGVISTASMTSELSRLGYSDSTPASLATVRRTHFAYDLVNRLRFTVDAMGGVMENVYDFTGNVVTTTMFAGVPTLAAYDEKTINAAVNRNDVSNRVTNFAYDAAGNQRFIARLLAPAVGTTPAQWIVSEKVFDVLNRVVQNIDYSTVLKTAVNVNDAAAMATARQTSDQDRINAVAYDHAGRVAYQAVAQTVTAARTGMTYAVSRTILDSLGHVVQSTAFAQGLSPTDLTLAGFDAAVTPAVANDARNRTTRFVFDGVGRVRFVVAADGGLNETLYDTLGRVTEKRQFDLRVNADTPITEAALTAFRAGRHVGDGVTRGERYTYDAVGRKKSRIDALGFTEKYDYDTLGNLEFRTDKKGQVWQNVFDLLGRVSDELSPSVTVQQSDGTMRTGVLRTHYGYDAFGNLKRKIEATDTIDQRFTDYAYDLLGRQTKVTLPGIYDPNLHRVVANSSASGVFLRTLETVYDTFGDAVRTGVRTGAGTNDVQFEYKTFDNRGHVVHDVDAFGHVTKFAYTSFGEQSAVTRYSDAIAVGKPTAANGLWSVSDVDAKLVNDPNSRTVTTDYDNSGRKKRVTQQAVDSYFYSRPGAFPVADSIVPAHGAATTQYEYNIFGDLFHEVQAQSDTTSQETWHYYDAKGREIRTLQKVSDGNGAVLPRAFDTERIFDPLDNVRQVIEYAGTTSVDPSSTLTPPATPAPSAADHITGYTYDADNHQKTVVKYGLTYTDGSLTDVTKARDQGVVISSMDYDALGRVNRVTDALNNVTVTEYDALSRVISVTEPARLVKSSSAVDPFASGGQVMVSPVTTMTYGAFGEVRTTTRSSGGVSPAIITKQDYDFAGNLIASTDARNNVTAYEVDYAGRTTRATTHITATLGQRLPPSDIPPAITWRTIDHTIERRFAYDLLGRTTDILDVFLDDSGANLLQSGQRKKYNSFGDVTDEQKVWGSASDALGALSVATVTKYSYDNAGHRTSTQNAAGLTHYFYNLSGQVTRQEQLGNGSAADGTTTRVSEMAFDRLGRTIEVRNPSFRTSEPGATSIMVTPFISLTLDRWGNIAERDVSAYTLNTGGIGLLQTTFYSYNADNQVTSESHGPMNTLSADGIIHFLDTRHETHYDLKGQAVKELDIARDFFARTDSAPLRVHTRTFDAAGNVTSQTTGLASDSAGVGTTRYAYDANGNKVASIDAGGTVLVDDFDANGNLISHAILRNPDLKDPYAGGSGQAAVAVLLNTRRYDQANRLIEEEDYTQPTTAAGGGAFRATFTAYDERSFARATFTVWEARIHVETDIPRAFNDGVETSCSYDILGNKTREEDAAHNVTTWQYDTTPDSTQPGVPPTFQVGLLRRVNVGGHVTDYFYNDFDQVSLEKYSGVDIPDPAAANQRTYTYNANGLVSSVTDVTSIGSPGPLNGADHSSTASTTTYRYNSLGLVSRETVHSTGIYDVDTSNGVVIKSLPTVDRATAMTYDTLGRLKSEELIDLGTASNPRSHGLVSYDYDELGDRRRISYSYTGVHVDPGSSPQTDTPQAKENWFEFDSEGRMTLANRVVINGVATDTGTLITYDALGRRATASFAEGNKSVGVNSTTIRFVPDPRPTGLMVQAAFPTLTTYTWFQSRTERYSYDDMGLLTKVEQSVTQSGKIFAVSYGTGRTLSGGDSVPALPPEPAQPAPVTGPTPFVLYATRSYNLFGQVIDAQQYEPITFTGGGIGDFHANLSTTTHSDYDNNGHLIDEVTNDILHPANTNKSTLIYNFDAAGILRSSEFRFGPNNGIGGTPENHIDSYQYFYTFVAGGLKESQVTVTSTQPRSVPGNTHSQYDARGNLITQWLDNQADTNRERRLFSYDDQGRVLTRDVIFTNQAESQILKPGGSQDFLYSDGREVGEIGSGSLGSTTQFSNDFTPVSSTYPLSQPSSHAVVAGDTLAGIAQAYLGDANLWYLIADANGVNAGPTQELPPSEIGRVYRIPNVVDSLHNNASTYRPYNPSSILGSSTPTPGLLPPPGETTCHQITGVISMAVTMIVAGVGTAVLSPFIGPVAAGAIAGAAGNALGQLTWIAAGEKSWDSFSGWDVLEAGAEGAVGGFLGGVTKGITEGAGIYTQIAAQGISGGASAVANSAVHGFFNRVRGREDDWNLSWEGLEESIGTGAASPILAGGFGNWDSEHLKIGSAAQDFFVNSVKPSGWVWQDDSRQWSSLVSAAVGAGSSVIVGGVRSYTDHWGQESPSAGPRQMVDIVTESPYEVADIDTESPYETGSQAPVDVADPLVTAGQKHVVDAQGNEWDERGNQIRFVVPKGVTNLEQVARLAYGSGRLRPAVVAANPDINEAHDEIEEGMILNLIAKDDLNLAGVEKQYQADWRQEDAAARKLESRAATARLLATAAYADGIDEGSERAEATIRAKSTWDANVYMGLVDKAEELNQTYRLEAGVELYMSSHGMDRQNPNLVALVRAHATEVPEIARFTDEVTYSDHDVYKALVDDQNRGVIGPLADAKEDWKDEHVIKTQRALDQFSQGGAWNRTAGFAKAVNNAFWFGMDSVFIPDTYVGAALTLLPGVIDAGQAASNFERALSSTGGAPNGIRLLSAGSPGTYAAQADALLSAEAADLIANGDTSGVALARAVSEKDGLLGPSYKNFFPYDPASSLPGAVHVPSELSNNLFKIHDPEAYIDGLKDLYAQSGTPMHPELEANIRAHIGDGEQLVGKGLPGTHAEVRAFNWALQNGAASENMTIYTYRLVEGTNQGGYFIACHNCSCVISPQVTVPTARSPSPPPWH